MTETIDDQVQATMKKEKDDFDSAFDEIEGKDPELHKALHGDDDVIIKDDTKGTSLNGEDGKSQTQAAGKTPDSAKVDEASSQETEEEKKAREAKEAEKGIDTSLFDGLKDGKTVDQQSNNQSATGDNPEIDKLKQENSDLQAALKQEQQKTSSWSGRIKKANDKSDELENSNKELLSRIEALESGTVKPKNETAEDGTDRNAKVTQFFKDFPEFEEPLKILLDKAKGTTGEKVLTLDEVMEAVKPEVEKVKTQTQEDTSQDKFMVALRQQHSDVDAIIASGKVAEWIKKQPMYIAKELERIYTEGGSLTESVNLLNEFKRTSGYKATPQSTNDTQNKNDKLNSMLEVDSDGTGPPAGQPDKSDFNAAADEAFKDE